MTQARRAHRALAVLGPGAVAAGLALSAMGGVEAGASPGWSLHLLVDLRAATLTEVKDATVAEPPVPCGGEDPDGILAYVREGAHVEVRARTAEVPSFVWTWKGTKARPGYAAGAAHGAGAVVVAVDATGTTDVERLMAFDVATRRKLWTRRTNVIDLRDLAGPFVALATPAGVEVIDARTGKVRGSAPLRPTRFTGQCLAGGTALVLTDAGSAAVDEFTGAARWTLPGRVDSVVAAGGNLLLATLDDVVLRLTSVDPATGAVRARWERADISARVGGDGRYVALSPLGPERAVVHVHGWVE